MKRPTPPRPSSEANGAPSSGPGECGGRGAAPQPPPPYVDLSAAGKVLQLCVAKDNPSALIGLTDHDAELLRTLSVYTGPTHLYRLINGAKSAGVAIMIRTDLPDVP